MSNGASLPQWNKFCSATLESNALAVSTFITNIFGREKDFNMLKLRGSCFA
jgi:hypothetical protein